MLGAVVESEVLTIIPERAIDLGKLGGLQAVRLRDPKPVRTSALLWPRFGFRTIAARTFGKMVRTRLGTPPRGS